MERNETLQIMDQLEALILKKGWPVPFTPYYLVHHERMLTLMDKLRVSLQDELDARFLQAFGQTEYRQANRKVQIGKGEMSMNTLIKLLDRLETLMLRAIPIWGTSLSIVKSEKILMMVEKIQECIPEEVRQAEQLINRRDEILAEAQRKATQMLQEAKVQAEFMLSESELLRAVHGEAERVRQQVIQDIEAMRKKTYEESESMKALAYEESKAVREGADQYADTILSSLDKSLAEFQTVVRNGQKHLKKSRSEAIQQASHIASQLRSVQQSAQAAAANPSSLQPSKAQNYLKQPVQVEV